MMVAVMRSMLVRADTHRARGGLRATHGGETQTTRSSGKEGAVEYESGGCQGT